MPNVLIYFCKYGALLSTKTSRLVLAIKITILALGCSSNGKLENELLSYQSLQLFRPELQHFNIDDLTLDSSNSYRTSYYSGKISNYSKPNLRVSINSVVHSSGNL